MLRQPRAECCPAGARDAPLARQCNELRGMEGARGCLALRPPDGELFQVRRACARKVCLDKDILSLFAHVTAVCVIVLVKREPQSSGLAMHPEVPIVIFQNIVACRHA